MRSPHPQRISYVDTGLPSEQIEEFVRFARGLDAHSDPEQLMRSLPAELSNLVVSNTTALILSKESALSGYVLDGEELAIGPESLSESLQDETWQDEIRQMISEQSHPFVVSSLDEEIRFHEAVRFFRERGNQSLCVCFRSMTALRQLGALCFARGTPEAPSPRTEIDLLSYGLPTTLRWHSTICLNFATFRSRASSVGERAEEVAAHPGSEQQRGVQP